MSSDRIPRIVDRLLANDGEDIRQYFQEPTSGNGDERIWNRISRRDENSTHKWVDDFKKKANSKSLDHDEPWVTLVAMYGLFGDQEDLVYNHHRLETINELFSGVFQNRQDNPTPPQFDGLTGAHLEIKLPEILRYRGYLRQSIFAEGAYHLYPDRRRILEGKLKKEIASLEGNTNLDVLISGKSKGCDIHVFIEAKFLSDISKDITYVPVRNQIARNIDSAINLLTEDGKNLDGLNDFWFVLLTPGIFRTEKYGGPARSPMAPFEPERSRLYCYKMDDYLDSNLLRRDLPHWKGVLKDNDWDLISKRIGWLTFEDIIAEVISGGTLAGDTLEDFQAFFSDRSLLPHPPSP